MIYTIGYQRIKPEFLLKVAQALNATVIDCRFKPMSRIKGFGGRQIKELLGTRYDWQGLELGGRGYTTTVGINYLKQFYPTKAANVLLMCMEHSPADCHRHSAICSPHFPKALHLFEDEIFEAAQLDFAMRFNRTYRIDGAVSDLFES